MKGTSINTFFRSYYGSLMNNDLNSFLKLFAPSATASFEDPDLETPDSAPSNVSSIDEKTFKRIVLEYGSSFDVASYHVHDGGAIVFLIVNGLYGASRVPVLHTFGFQGASVGDGKRGLEIVVHALRKVESFEEPAAAPAPAPAPAPVAISAPVTQVVAPNPESFGAIGRGVEAPKHYAVDPALELPAAIEVLIGGDLGLPVGDKKAAGDKRREPRGARRGKGAEDKKPRDPKAPEADAAATALPAAPTVAASTDAPAARDAKGARKPRSDGKKKTGAAGAAGAAAGATDVAAAAVSHVDPVESTATRAAQEVISGHNDFNGDAHVVEQAPVGTGLDGAPKAWGNAPRPAAVGGRAWAARAAIAPVTAASHVAAAAPAVTARQTAPKASEGTETRAPQANGTESGGRRAGGRGGAGRARGGKVSA